MGDLFSYVKIKSNKEFCLFVFKFLAAFINFAMQQLSFVCFAQGHIDGGF